MPKGSNIINGQVILVKEIYKASEVLTDENINRIMDELPDIYFKELGKQALEKTKFVIALEELLLRFRDYYGTENVCDVSFCKHFGKYLIEISMQGMRKDYIPCSDDMKISYDILANLGVEPRYAYSQGRSGKNRLIWQSLSKPKKHSTALPILFAFILAVIAGIIISYLPKDIHTMLTEDFITPIFSKMTLIISALATPLVLFAVIDGIVGIGDVKAFGKIGSKLLLRMTISYLIAGILIAAGCGIVYGVSSEVASTADGTSALGKIVKLVLDIVPDNILAPFTIDNDLQVIVIAIFIGVTMLILQNSLPITGSIIKEGSLLVNKMMSICCKLLPVVVFFGVSNLIATSNAKQFISIGKMLAIYVVVNFVFMASMVIRARIVTGIPLKYIIPKQLATLMINITTSSQVAALPENMKCCKEKFGIDSKLVDFALPLGIVIYMPSGAIFLTLTALGFMVVAGLPITINMLIRIAIIGTIVAIAAPPIPGSALVVLPILFASCGVPNDVFPLAIIFGTIIGYILPACNGFNIQLELLMTATKLKKTDGRLQKEAGIAAKK